MEFIFEVIVIYLFSYPGALIRWIILKIFGSKKKLDDCINQDSTQNAFIAFLFFGMLFILINIFTS